MKSYSMDENSALYETSTGTTSTLSHQEHHHYQYDGTNAAPTASSASASERAQVEKLEKMVADERAELDDEVASFISMMQNIDAFRPASDTLTSLLQQAPVECIKDTEAVEELQYQKHILVRELLESKTKVRKLEEEGSILKVELANAKLSVTELESRNSLLKKLSIDAKQIINKLQSGLMVANNKLRTNAEVLQEHTAKTQVLTAIKESLLFEKEKLACEMEKLQETICAKEEEISKSKADLEKTEAYVAQLDCHKETLLSEKAKLILDMEKLQETSEEELNKMKADLKKAVGHIAELESDKELLQTRLQELQNTDLHKQTISNVERNDVIIKRELDSGGWGSVSVGVYRGVQVAVKRPHKEILHEKTIERLKREVHHMAQVHHPNLVTFIGAVFDDQPRPLILIELMDMNLRSAYEQKLIVRREQIISIFKDVAYALHYLHEFREPIIHRDVSAPNVLLKNLPNGQYIAKVSDFGSANIEKFAITKGEGAIIYSAPEMFPPIDRRERQHKQTVKVDTFSYGILLCEVIEYQLPDPQKFAEMLSSVNRKWENMHTLILQCIETDPARRPTMAQILNTLSD